MMRRFFILAGLWIICGVISTLTFAVIWGSAAVPSLGSLIAHHLAYGLLALPISFGAVFAAVLPEVLSVIPVMLMYAYWLVLGYFQVIYIRNGTRAELVGACVLALIAAPLWLYYAAGMSGI